jgi:hypothetical protein
MTRFFIGFFITQQWMNLCGRWLKNGGEGLQKKQTSTFVVYDMVVTGNKEDSASSALLQLRTNANYE